MSSVTQSVQFKNLGIGNTAAFTLKGGKYMVLVSGAGATINLTALSTDGVTFMQTIPPLTPGASTGGYATVDLAPGQYRIEVTVAGSVFVSISSVPY